MTPDTMPAGAEMDRLVAEKVMGWVRGGANDQTKPAHVKETRKRPGEPAEIVDVLDWGQKGPHDYLTLGAVRVWLCGCETPHRHEIPRYSTDIAAAWEVVERLRMKVEAGNYPRSITASCWVSPELIEAEASIAPLAICRAALKARL